MKKFYKMFGMKICSRSFFVFKESLLEKCQNTEFFLVRISRIRTEFGEILRISPYSVRMRENEVVLNSL